MKRHTSRAPREAAGTSDGRRNRHPAPSTPKPVPRDARWAQDDRAQAQAARGRLIDADDSTLLDVIDNLLSKGAVLNADLILALANVDLVYVRLSALLCAADRILKRAPR